MSAREIIVKSIERSEGHGGKFPPWGVVAQRAIEDLTAAGHRILAPEQNDPETVERCAQVADDHAKTWGRAFSSGRHCYSGCHPHPQFRSRSGFQCRRKIAIRCERIE